MKYREHRNRIISYIVKDLKRDSWILNEVSEENLQGLLYRKYMSQGKDPMEYIYDNSRYSLWRCNLPGKEGIRLYDKLIKRTKKYYIFSEGICFEPCSRKKTKFEDL